MTKKELLLRLKDVDDDAEIALDDSVRLIYDFRVLNAFDGEDSTPVVIITE